MLRRIRIFENLILRKIFLNNISVDFLQLCEFLISIAKLFKLIIVSHCVYSRARIIFEIFIFFSYFSILLDGVIEFIFFKNYIFWYLEMLILLFFLCFHRINYIVWRSGSSVYLLYLICKQIIF